MTPRLKGLLALLLIVLAAGVWRFVTWPRSGKGGALYREALAESERGNTPGTLDLLRRAVVAEPENGEYHAELGTRYLRARQNERALAELEAAAFLQPGLPHVFCYLAECLVETRQREGALSAVETALRKSPNCPHALLVRGEQHLRDDNLKAALADFQRAAELDPGSALAHQKVGYILLETQQYQAAREALEKGLKLSPSHPGTHLMLGQVYLKLGGGAQNAALARQHLQASLYNNPEAPKARVLLGQLNLREGKVEEARQEFEAALAGQPDVQDAEYGLAQVALRQSRPDEAARHQSQVELAQRRRQELSELQARASTAASDPRTVLRLARLSLETGALKNAERTLTTLIGAHPDLREARELRAELFEKLNQPEQAAREAAIALRLPRTRTD